MVKVLMYALLPGVALAGAISTRAEAQDEVVHTFQCPHSVTVWASYEFKISSDPSFSREASPRLQTGFRRSERNGQMVSCVYAGSLGGMFLTYSYAAKREILSCKNVGSRTFTCNLKP